MPADFVANDFEAIARAMKRIATSSSVVLHFWDMFVRLTSMHESVEAAVAEAYTFVVSDTAVPVLITATDGTVLMNDKELAEAMIRFGGRLPT